MIQLLSNYSVGEILIFIIAIALAIKEFVQFKDWAKTRTTQAVKQAQQPKQIKEKMQQHQEQISDIQTDIKDIKESINLLIESDKDDIKQSLTKDHHYFCYKLKSIDDYSLDCMERRYSHYTDEGGNSFVETLMNEVRALPRKIETENR